MTRNYLCPSGFLSGLDVRFEFVTVANATSAGAFETRRFGLVTLDMPNPVSNEMLASTT